MKGRIYTETIVHAAPAALAAEAPYQLAVIDLDPETQGQAASRITARILPGPSGERAQIGDRVEQAGEQAGVPMFRRVD
jgi:uncharacterized OB-fold protein